MRRFLAAGLAGLSSLLLPLLWPLLCAVACAPRARMCAATECPAPGACVAGRCQAGDAGLEPVIAEQGDGGALVRRIVALPVDVAWLRRGDGAAAGASMPAVFTMGRASDGGAVLLTRFAVALPPEAQIVEAYLLLARSDAVDADPSPIGLYATRIVEPWDSRALSWATQPRTEEGRAAVTRVFGGSRGLVRVDVRSLVARWAAHDRRDQGLALVAEGVNATGVPFTFLPTGGARPVGGAGSQGAAPPPLGERLERAAPSIDAPVELRSPRLELYVK